MIKCARCGEKLPGLGVLNGMVCSDMDDTGKMVELIVCYVNGCRDAVLDGLVLHPRSSGCVVCGGRLTVRGVSEALLTTDLHPNGSGLSRSLAFCHANGHRDQLLGRITTI